MDLENDSGRWHFSLGPVEKWAIGAGAAALFSVCAWTGNSFSTRLDRLEQLMNISATQTAVANAQMTTISGQLADVPGLTRKMAEFEVRLDRIEEDSKELRSVRQLR